MRYAIAVALAALFVSVNANAFLYCQNQTTGDSVSWYVSQPVPSLNIAGDVVCAANGAELDYIRSKFAGINMRNGNAGRTVIWRGETAVFILDNL